MAKLSEETRRRMSIAHKGKEFSDSHKCHLSQSHKGHPVSEETRNKLGMIARKGKSQEARTKMSIARKGKTFSAIHKHHISEGHKGIHPSATQKQHLSEIHRKLWQNPEFVKRMIKAFGHKPTSVERKVAAILDKYLPHQFAYNGNFGLGISIGGQIPDFVNVNGQKSIIEVFGDYWHSQELIKNEWRRSELGKIMLYKALGYDCLVLWEKDIKNQSDKEIANSIKQFSTRGKTTGGDK